MTWTLLRKELQQHWLALVLLGLLALTGFALVAGAAFFQGEAGSAFETLRVFVFTMTTLSGLVLCHRLVVVEYQARTQLFLEALPLSRWRMISVKYLLGLGVLMGIVSVVFVLSCLLAAKHEALTPRFVAILAARAFAAAWFAYNFFFLMGFLGRYRLALYVACVLALIAVEAMTDLKLNRFGPFALLDERFAYERVEFPIDALQTTLGLCAAFLLLTGALALTREGSVAALLSEKMSHREKVFIAALLIGFLFAVSIFGEKKKKAPFDLLDAIIEQRRGVVVKVAASASRHDAVARRLAQHVADELVAVENYLGLQALPPVFITRRGDLDANRYERGELKEAEGVHVQANFAASAWNEQDFTGWLLREALVVGSQGRVKLEPKYWVLDGFMLWWTRRTQAPEPIERDRALALRALYGAAAGFTAPDLQRWLSFRERVGEDIAAGVAWSGLKTLVRREGPERAQKFIRAVLAAEVPKDFRALRHERAKPMESLLAEEAGVVFEEFFTQWLADLAAARRELAADVAALPRLRGQVSFVPLSADTRKVSFRLTIEGPASAETRYSFLHHVLPVFDEEVSPQKIRREQHNYALAREGELPESFGRGTRLYSTFALEVPALGCQVISGWTRREIP